MNTEYMDYCFKSIKRRKKNIIKTSFTIFIVFAAVTLLILIRTNVYQWQLQSVKDRFGSWFVMMCGSDGKENSELKGHPYLKESGKAVKVNNVYDNGGEMTETGIGYMTEEFIRLGNISTEEGHFPQKDDEAAVDWNTLYSMFSRISFRYSSITSSGCAPGWIDESVLLNSVLFLSVLLHSVFPRS